MVIDRVGPGRFLETAYAPGDHVALLLKSSAAGGVMQRIVSRDAACASRFQAWLRACNAQGWNVYVGVNAVAAGRSRTREAVTAVRHVFLDADYDVDGVLGRIGTESGLPPPSYQLQSSPGKLHVFWRVQGMSPDDVERVQKCLARTLRTDTAATSCAQLTRLPGFVNHKYATKPVVTISYLAAQVVLDAEHFVHIVERAAPGPPAERRFIRRVSTTPALRARGFLRDLPPAIQGQHGDLQTFRVCCRLVRGFALPDEDAWPLLREWNARCEPPWSDDELAAKLRAARRHGKEAIGGLL